MRAECPVKVTSPARHGRDGDGMASLCGRPNKSEHRP